MRAAVSVCAHAYKGGRALYVARGLQLPTKWTMSETREAGSLVEELADAKLPPKAEVLAIVESLTLSFLESLTRGEDPSLYLVRERGRDGLYSLQSSI